MLSRPQIGVVFVGFLLLLALPPIALAFEQDYYISLFARILIFAIAAVSLDLILGYGGMVSFGHAAYLGIGGYAVAIFSFYEIDNGYLQLVAAILGSAVVALIIGAISLRTSGLYFIMITLAFTQMLFFLGISLEEYGGDDGINTNRSEFFDALNLYDPAIFYYFTLAILVVCVFLCYRLINSRFGMAIRASHSNDVRMQAIGFPTYRYKLTAFVIAGAMCGIAGFLLANRTEFVTPTFMHWFRSGEIMIMVLLGGMGTLFGPILGAIAFLLLEEWIPDVLDGVEPGLGQHWMIFFGPVLVLIVLFARKGLWGLIPAARRGDG